MMNKELLRDYEGEDSIISSLQYLDYLEKNVPDVPPIYTGMEMLDEYLNGFVPGEFIVLSGKPKHGKSLLMKTFINQFYQRGTLSVVFSYEEQPKQFFKSFDEGGKNILFYMPRKLKANDHHWIEERAIEAKEKAGVKIVFIDHGHYLFRMVEHANISSVVGDITRNLKRMAVNEGLIVFLIWHLKKTQGVTLESLSDEDLRDSGMVSAESDVLTFNYRQVKSNGVCTEESSYLKIAHSRRTGVMQKTIPLIKAGAYFREMEVLDEG